ncbi:uncharacterized protein LOC144107516 isoform X3 [Amblyomma americanum]
MVLQTSRQAMVNGTSKSRETLKEFLRKRVESHPGISIQKLTGHLSQLPAEIRLKYGGNVDSIRRVLEQFPEIFIIRNHDQVHVANSKTANKQAGASSGANSDDETTTTLTGAKGKVYRMFKTYGFISVQHPISTSVYFSLRSFENGQHSSLLSSGLQLGDGVVLDAEVGPNDCEAKFRASRVTRIKGAGASASPSDSSSPAPQSTVLLPLVNRIGAIETLKDEFGFIKLEKEQECAFFHAAEIERYLGTAVPALPEVLAVGDKIRFDADLNKNTTARAKWVVTTIHNIQNVPPCHSGSETEGSEIAPGTIIKEKGLIQMVKPEFGFIKFGTNYRDRAFFHLNNVALPPRDTIKSLPDVFTINDPVRFEAKPSQKPSEKVKWQATTVWLGDLGTKDVLDSADESGNEVFLSDDESDIMDLIQDGLAAGNASDLEDDGLGAGSGLPLASSQTLVDGLRQHLRVETHDLLSSPKDFNHHFRDLHKDEAFGHMPQSVEPSIVIYRGATGIVTNVTDYGGTIEVQDQASPGSSGSRQVEFSNAVFYRDGSLCVKELCQVLGRGDAVALDYMVGSNGSREEVRCDLVWQGMRPHDVPQMSPEEFGQHLQIKAPVHHGGPTYDDFQREIQEAGLCLSDDVNPRRRRNNHSPLSIPPTSSETSPTSPSGSIHGDHGMPNGVCGNPLGSNGIFSNDVSDGVLRRLAKIMAQELHALQQNERVAKGSVRDASTQTAERLVRPVL